MESSIIQLIYNYHREVMRVKNAFYTKFGRHDLLNAFKEKSIAKEGNIIELGILYYYFHGNSLYTLVSDKVIEFDFLSDDGIDFWNLKKLAQSQSHKYKTLLEGNRLKEDFKQLSRTGISKKMCPFRRYYISVLLINNSMPQESVKKWRHFSNEIIDIVSKLYSRLFSLKKTADNTYSETL